MKRALVAAAASALLAGPAWAQPYGMGPGMSGGYGSGPGAGMGMMWGDGTYGYAPGMMWGYGPGGYDYGDLNLSSDQRAKINAVEEDFARKEWALMGSMREAGFRMRDAYRSGKLDEQAALKAYDTMADARKQMFKLSLEARKRIDEVLTPQQRKQLNGE